MNAYEYIYRHILTEAEQPFTDLQTYYDYLKQAPDNDYYEAADNEEAILLYPPSKAQSILNIKPPTDPTNPKAIYEATKDYFGDTVTWEQMVIFIYKGHSLFLIGLIGQWEESHVAVPGDLINTPYGPGKPDYRTISELWRNTNIILVHSHPSSHVEDTIMHIQQGKPLNHTANINGIDCNLDLEQLLNIASPSTGDMKSIPAFRASLSPLWATLFAMHIYTPVSTTKYGPNLLKPQIYVINNHNGQYTQLLQQGPKAHKYPYTSLEVIE